MSKVRGKKLLVTVIVAVAVTFSLSAGAALLPDGFKSKASDVVDKPESVDYEGRTTTGSVDERRAEPAPAADGRAFSEDEVLGGGASEFSPSAIKELLATRYQDSNDICRAIETTVAEGKSSRRITNQGIEMGHSPCLVLKCVIEAGGNPEYAVIGAVEAGITYTMLNECGVPRQAIEQGRRFACVGLPNMGYEPGREPARPYDSRQLESMLRASYGQTGQWCSAIGNTLQRDGGQDPYALTSTAIRIGRSPCEALSCVIGSGGNPVRSMFGALEAGVTPDVISRCAIEAGAPRYEMAKVFECAEVPEIAYALPADPFLDEPAYDPTALEQEELAAEVISIETEGTSLGTAGGGNVSPFTF